MKIGRYEIGIDTISVFDMPPLDYVALAADLDIGAISIAPAPFVENPHEYPAWSLRDAATRRKTIAALRDRGVAISVGEGFLVMPGREVDSVAGDLDLMGELGATRVNLVALHRDLAWSFDQVAKFAEMAAERGLQPLLEFIPGIALADLATGVAAARQAGHGCAVVVDFMHLVRSGGSAADIAALDPALVGHVQLCDVPLVSTHPNYGLEARDYRLPPGEGELPLAALMAAVPEGVTVGLEVPMLDRARAGIGPHARLSACIAATRALIGG